MATPAKPIKPPVRLLKGFWGLTNIASSWSMIKETRAGSNLTIALSRQRGLQEIYIRFELDGGSFPLFVPARQSSDPWKGISLQLVIETFRMSDLTVKVYAAESYL